MVTRAVIAAAGLGTRFLPQTKAMPKEMLPIVDKPVIQIIVEELVEIGVTDIIIVTGPQKRAIEDHFDRAYELELALNEKGKKDKAEEIQRIGEMANFVYVRQKGEVLGTALPVMNASHLIQDEPFFYFTGDDLFLGEVSRAKQLLETYKKTKKSVVSLVEVPKSDADKYGMAEIDGEVKDNTVKLKGIVEKPGEEKTPSNYAAVMSYLFAEGAIKHFDGIKPGVNGEIHAVDAVTSIAKQDGAYGRVIEGTYHDCGDKFNYLKAVFDYGMQDEDISQKLKDYVQKKI